MFSLEISGFAIKIFGSAQSLYHTSLLTSAACGSSCMGLPHLIMGLPQNVFKNLAKGQYISLASTQALGPTDAQRMTHLSGISTY